MGDLPRGAEKSENPHRRPRILAHFVGLTGYGII
jgi:hypothetical protein